MPSTGRSGFTATLAVCWKGPSTNCSASNRELRNSETTASSDAMRASAPNTIGIGICVINRALPLSVPFMCILRVYNRSRLHENR